MACPDRLVDGGLVLDLDHDLLHTYALTRRDFFPCQLRGLAWSLRSNHFLNDLIMLVSGRPFPFTRMLLRGLPLKFFG